MQVWNSLSVSFSTVWKSVVLNRGILITLGRKKEKKRESRGTLERVFALIPTHSQMDDIHSFLKVWNIWLIH